MLRHESEIKELVCKDRELSSFLKIHNLAIIRDFDVLSCQNGNQNECLQTNFSSRREKTFFNILIDCLSGRYTTTLQTLFFVCKYFYI